MKARVFLGLTVAALWLSACNANTTADVTSTDDPAMVKEEPGEAIEAESADEEDEAVVEVEAGAEADVSE